MLCGITEFVCSIFVLKLGRHQSNLGDFYLAESLRFGIRHVNIIYFIQCMPYKKSHCKLNAQRNVMYPSDVEC